MKTFIQNNFNLMMLVGVLAGLFMPGLEMLPKETAIVVTAFIIFFSCSKVSLNEVKEIDKTTAALFYAFRFLLFPTVAFYIALQVIPDYAVGVLLISLMPAGVTSTAVTNICKGNTSFALSATIITHILTPLTVPVLIMLIAGQHIEINTLNMFITLCLAVFIPAICYFLGADKKPRVRNWIKSEAQFYSIILTSANVGIVIALQRSYFFTELDTVLWAIVIGMVLFFSFYAVAWLYPSKLSLRDRKTYAICSGVNNIALAAGISVLYFSPFTILLCVLGEIPWVIGVAIFERFARRRS